MPHNPYDKLIFRGSHLTRASPGREPTDFYRGERPHPKIIWRNGRRIHPQKFSHNRYQFISPALSLDLSLARVLV